MNQHVQDRFPKGQERDRERIDSLAGLHGAGEEHMLLAEIDDGIVLFEQVAFADRLITELTHCSTFKTSEPYLALVVETSGLFAEENDGRIMDAVFDVSDFEMRNLRRNVLELESGRGDTPDIDPA